MKKALSVALALSLLCNVGLLRQRGTPAAVQPKRTTWVDDGFFSPPLRQPLPAPEAQEALQKAAETENVLLAQIMKLQDDVTVLKAFSEAEPWPRFPPWLMLDEEVRRTLGLSEAFVDASSRACFATTIGAARKELEIMAQELGLSPGESRGFVQGALQAADTLRRLHGETEREYDRKRNLGEDLSSLARERDKVRAIHRRASVALLIEGVRDRGVQTAALREILPEVLYGLSTQLKN
jgi:hypothetical protein